MEKSKSTERLLLESGFSRREVKGIKINAVRLNAVVEVEMYNDGRIAFKAVTLCSFVIILTAVVTCIDQGANEAFFSACLLTLPAALSFIFDKPRSYVKAMIYFIKVFNLSRHV